MEGDIELSYTAAPAEPGGPIEFIEPDEDEPEPEADQEETQEEESPEPDEPEDDN